MNDLSLRLRPSCLHFFSFIFHFNFSFSHPLQSRPIMATTGSKPQRQTSILRPCPVSGPKTIPTITPSLRGMSMQYSLRDSVSLKPVYDNTHRRLLSGHINLIGIERTIGEWPETKSAVLPAERSFLPRGAALFWHQWCWLGPGYGVLL